MFVIILTFLGTGTSHGVPVIGCKCETCTSSDPRDKRDRCSILIRKSDSSHDTHILIDCPPEFRLQALRENIARIDAVFLTHSHADHIFGLDDLRRYNNVQKSEIPIYANVDTLADIRRSFQYAFIETQMGGGKPQFHLREIRAGSIIPIGDVEIRPLTVYHGALEILGYRIGCENGLAYITDCSFLPQETIDRLDHLDTLVIGALRHRTHSTHMNVEQAIETAARVGARRTFFTHIAHDLTHEITQRNLPDNIYLAYDGLELTI